MGDERAHAELVGERQCLAVVGLATLGIEPVGMGRDVAEQVQRARGTFEGFSLSETPTPDSAVPAFAAHQS